MDTFKNFVSIMFNPRILGILSAVYGVLSFIRDEFLPPEVAEKFRLGGLLSVIDWYWWVILGLVLWSASIAWEYAKQGKQNRPPENQSKGITAGGHVINSPNVKAEGQGKAAGRDINEPHYYYYGNEAAVSTPEKWVVLDVQPQGKPVNGEPYIIVVVINKEKIRVFCRTEIRGIFDETGRNILRDISQFANHFSWSGGRATDEGMRLIEAGLDGTVNIATIRHDAYNFYWLFHEDPNKNWGNPGIYKLDLAIQGTIGGVGFFGKNLRIEFEYIERTERGDYGDFSNKGQLKLLDWKVEESNETWLIS